MCLEKKHTQAYRELLEHARAHTHKQCTNQLGYIVDNQ